MAAKNSDLMAKILSRISQLDELHPWELQINKILLEYIEGHPEGVIYKTIEHS